MEDFPQLTREDICIDLLPVVKGLFLKKNKNFGLVVFVVVPLYGQLTHAQVVPAGVEAGRIEDRFEERSAPLAQPSIRSGLESTIPPAEAAGIALHIQGFRIVGATALPASDLDAVVAPFTRADGTLLDVFQAAAAVTSLYGDRGFLLSRAIVPPQELEPSGAIITLQIIEGYVDRVDLPESLGSREKLLKRHAGNIEASRPLNADQLEREMLLANDIPGLSVRSNLSASSTISNASTLTLTTEEDPGGWSLRLDNRGSDASGPLQLTVAGELNNALGWNEQFNGGLTLTGPSDGSSGTELVYLYWGYEQVLNAQGLRFGLSGNVSRGDPDSAILTPLEYETEGFNLTTQLSYPFIRTRSRNLTGTLAFDLKNSKSTTSGGVTSEDRLRILRVELAFDNADQFSGINQVLFSLSQGISGFGSTSNSNPNASRTPGKVDFTKAELTLSRTQQLGNGFSMFGSLSGQWTSDALLSSQECGYGGTQFGRGFDSSIITGDTCLKAAVEMRYNLSDLGNSGLDYTQVFGFADAGRIKNIDAPLGTPSSDNAASFGLGARFGAGKWRVDLSASKPIDTPSSVVASRAWQGWFSVSAQF